MRRAFDLVLECEGVDASAGPNGAPLARVAGPQAQQLSVPIDWWLLPEDNVLSLTVSPAHDGAARVTVAVVPTEDRGSPMVAARWRWAAGQLADGFAITLPFGASPAPRSVAVFDAMPDLTEGDLGAIRVVLGGLVDAVTRRDAASLVTQVEHRLRDFCASFDDDLVEHRAVVHDAFAEMLATMSLDPVALDEIRVTPCAGDRVFHVAKADGAELLVMRNVEGESVMQVFVGRVDGHWRVVR